MWEWCLLRPGASSGVPPSWGGAACCWACRHTGAPFQCGWILPRSLVALYAPKSPTNLEAIEGSDLGARERRALTRDLFDSLPILLFLQKHALQPITRPIKGRTSEFELHTAAPALSGSAAPCAPPAFHSAPLGAPKGWTIMCAPLRAPRASPRQRRDGVPRSRPRWPASRKERPCPLMILRPRWEKQLCKPNGACCMGSCRGTCRSGPSYASNPRRLSSPLPSRRRTQHLPGMRTHTPPTSRSTCWQTLASC